VTGDSEAGPPDSELLRLHIAGDHEAFGVLFARHRDRLWAVALRTLGDTEEAADALQEAMISAFRRAGSFRGDSAVTTWLHRIVVNACLDRVRRRASRPTVPAGDEQSLDMLVRGGVTSTDSVADHDAALDVDAALRMLPYEQRAALVLVDMLGYPVQVAAELLDVSVGTIKSRCARGRARLAPHLAHLRGPQPSEPAQRRQAQPESGPPRPRSPGPGISPGPFPGNRPGRGDVSTSQGDRGNRAHNPTDHVIRPMEGGGERQ
jgi:RNA polymerase sigma-70 factor (ECF subfamily)